MLQNSKELYGHHLIALDGEIGHIKDFYFDDQIWVVRYLVADTGSWLSGRLVLLSPHALGKWDQYGKILHVKLSKKQIQNSPSIESHKPVSRQYEIDYYRYYGWPVYWNGGAIWGLGGYPVVMAPSKDQLEAQLPPHHKGNKHLQSMYSITGYKIQALDAAIGSISGFKIDDRSWAIRNLVVESGHWYSGREILVTPDMVERISYEESTVFLKLTQANLQHTTENSFAPFGAAGSGTEYFSI